MCVYNNRHESCNEHNRWHYFHLASFCYFYFQGCAKKMTDFVERNFSAVGGVSIAFCFVQVHVHSNSFNCISCFERGGEIWTRDLKWYTHSVVHVVFCIFHSCLVPWRRAVWLDTSTRRNMNLWPRLFCRRKCRMTTMTMTMMTTTRA